MHNLYQNTTITFYPYNGTTTFRNVTIRVSYPYYIIIQCDLSAKHTVIQVLSWRWKLIDKIICLASWSKHGYLTRILNEKEVLHSIVKNTELTQRKTSLWTHTLLLLFIKTFFPLTSISRATSKCCQKFYFLAHCHWVGGTSNTPH
jgi:hypothetical protein